LKRIRLKESFYKLTNIQEMSNSVKLIREQKEEYMDHMFDLLYEFLYTQYKTIYQNLLLSKEAVKKGILKSFQKEVSKIPEWNQIKVEHLYQSFIEKKKCTYFHELLKTVYILSVKLVLLGLPKENRNKIQIKVPSPESYLHRIMIHIAREVWKRPYLFYHQVKSVEHQNHLYQFELVIRKKIRSVIRETLPMDLMVQYMSSGDVLETNHDSDTSESEPEESEPEESEPEESEAEEGEAEESEPEESEPEESEPEESEPEESEAEESEAEESEAEEPIVEVKAPIVEVPTEPIVEVKEPIVEVPIEPIIEVPTEPIVEVKEPILEHKNIPIQPNVIEEHETIYEQPIKKIHIQETSPKNKKKIKKPKNAFF